MAGMPSSLQGQITTIVLAIASLRCSDRATGGSPPEVLTDGGSADGAADVTDIADAADDGARVTPPPAEAGFVEIPAQVTSFLSAARLFYSYQPTKNGDGRPKPLFVFFNGGPGSATSTSLLAYGTGPFTLDHNALPDDPPRPNERSFARFGNLLYIDARNTGFSYNLRATEPVVGDCSGFLVEDAADFTRVLLRFLADHPTLRGAPIVLVGESYGGARAVSIFRIFSHYGDPSIALPDDLRAALQAHFDAIWPGTAGGIHSPEQIATLFPRLVLLQPLLGAEAQTSLQDRLVQDDPYLGPPLRAGGRNRHDVREEFDFMDVVGTRSRMALAAPGASEALLGFDLGQVGSLLPAARVEATHFGEFDSAAEARFQQRFGPLGPRDGYLVRTFDPCLVFPRLRNPAADSTDPWSWFPEVLRLSRVFITNARYDAVIHTPSIPVLLGQAGHHAVVDTAPRPDVARPGWVRVKLKGSDGLADKDIEVRFPTYADSGHEVARSQGPDFADDVGRWLAER
jgi:hypothetical protein